MIVEQESYRKRPPRLQVNQPASIVLPGGKTVQALITNLSDSGFSARCAGPILIGSELKIRAPEIGERDATVRWALGPHVGGKFV